MELLGRLWWWLVVLVLVHFGMNGCFGCWEQERIALLQYKASTINYTLLNIILHLGTQPTKRVIAVSGKKSSSSKLKVLYLDGNYFNNSILSSLSGIASLKELHLGDNNLNGEGFDIFYLLSKLEVLYLDVNSFNQSILQSLSGIMLLKELDLSYNNLNGTIHIKELSKLNNLEQLKLDSSSIDKMEDSGLNGTLPDLGRAGVNLRNSKRYTSAYKISSQKSYEH
ncbi:putative inactive receptor-like protein kinase [Quercus suber]|uniref:Inactive receptor-like protein kinase n=1 Tax=Quercus suber TaxID=58331 RepID=A0AAW0JN62_QUESU